LHTILALRAGAAQRRFQPRDDDGDSRAMSLHCRFQQR
jgi:hypothetical protein